MSKRDKVFVRRKAHEQSHLYSSSSSQSAPAPSSVTLSSVSRSQIPTSYGPPPPLSAPIDPFRDEEQLYQPTINLEREMMEDDIDNSPIQLDRIEKEKSTAKKRKPSTLSNIKNLFSRQKQPPAPRPVRNQPQQPLSTSYTPSNENFENTGEADLVDDGQMAGFKILIGDLCYGNGSPAIVDLPGGAGKAITAKGFSYDHTASTTQFLSMLQSGEYDLAWIISFQSDVNNKEFAKIVKKFHEDGNGLFIFNDDNAHVNSPSNVVLREIFGQNFYLTGETPAGKPLVPHETGLVPGTFKREHPIMDGILTLYEGVTICYPTTTHPDVHVLGTSSNNHPCVLYFDHPRRGRVIIDTGFTKLHNLSGYWESVGTGRYVRNASCWLTGARFLEIEEWMRSRLHSKCIDRVYNDVLIQCTV
jgi:hypothetical protein